MAQVLEQDGLDVAGTTAGVASGWTQDDQAGSTGTTTPTISTTAQRSGAGCQRLTKTLPVSGEYAGLYRTYSLSGRAYLGSTFTTSIYAKRAGTDGVVKIIPYIYELNSGGSIVATHTPESSSPLTTAYAAYSYSAVLTASTATAVEVRFNIDPVVSPGLTFAVDLDDYMLTSSLWLTGYTEDDFLRNLKIELDAMLASRQTAATVPNFGRVECDVPAVASGQFPALFLTWLSTIDGPTTEYAYPSQYFDRIVAARILLVNGLFDKKYNEAETRKLLHAVRAWLQAHRTINGYCIDFSVDRVESGDQAFLRSGGQVQSHGTIDVTGHVLETVTAT
jgi:hypothetical protein